MTTHYNRRISHPSAKTTRSWTHPDVHVEERPEGYRLTLNDRHESEIIIRPRRGQRIPIRTALDRGENPLDWAYHYESGAYILNVIGEPLTLREYPAIVQTSYMEVRVGVSDETL
jgi:hypothetical protein